MQIRIFGRFILGLVLGQWRLRNHLLIILAALFGSAQALADAIVKPDHLVVYEIPDPSHPETNIRWVFEKSALIDLQAQSPEMLRKDPLLRRAMRGGVNFAADVQRRFLPENLALTGSMSFLALRKMLTDPELHPDGIYNFLVHQVFDIYAQISFVGFVAGNKASGEIFDAVAKRHGWIFDQQKFDHLVTRIHAELPEMKFDDLRPMNDPARLALAERRWQAAVAIAKQEFPMPKNQMFWQLGKAGQGLAVGMFFASSSAEVLGDLDIQTCSSSWLKSPSEIGKDMLAGGKSPVLACEEAYQRWVIDRKIYDFLPDMVGMTMTFLTQALVVNPALIGLKNLAASGSKTFINYVFRGLNLTWNVGARSPTLVVITTIGNVVFQGYLFMEISEPIIKTLKDPWVESRVAEQMALRMRRLQKVSKGNSTQEFNIALRELKRTYQAWRQYWFSEASMALSSWRQYTSRVTDSYHDSFRLYQHVLTRLNKGHEDGIYQEFPFYSLSPTGSQSQVEGRLLGALDFIDARLKDPRDDFWGEQAKKEYRKLRSGLDIFTALRDGKSQPEVLANFKASITQLNLLAYQHTHFSRSKSPFGFRDLHKVLGYPQTLFRGELALQQIDEDPEVISTAQRLVFNDFNGRINIRSRSQSFLADMLCGPAFNDTGLPGKKMTEFSNEIFGAFALFRPPRLTLESSVNPCAPVGMGEKPFAMSEYQFLDSRGHQRRGFVDFLINNLNPRYQGTQGLKNFVNDWQAQVEPGVLRMTESWSVQIAELIENKVKPLLTTQEPSHINMAAPRSTPQWKEWPKATVPALDQELEFFLGVALDIASPNLRSKLAAQFLRLQGSLKDLWQLILTRNFRDVKLTAEENRDLQDWFDNRQKLEQLDSSIPRLQSEKTKQDDIYNRHIYEVLEMRTNFILVQISNTLEMEAPEERARVQALLSAVVRYLEEVKVTSILLESGRLN